jgi:excisionase family DNA binding protein
MNKEILIIQEAAEYLRVSVTTLRRYAYERRVTHYKLKGRIIFRKADLEKFLDTRKIESFEEYKGRNIL